MPRDIDIIVETGLRIAQRDAGKHIGKQREHRQRIKRVRIDGAARASGRRRDRSPRPSSAPRQSILDLDVVRSGSAQSGRVPGVDDLVVALVEQKDPIFDPVGFIVGGNDAGKHIPIAGIDARREWPAAAQQISAVDLPGAAGRKNEGGCDQRIGVLVPDQILGALVEHAQHPVVACQIGEIPGHRRVGLPDRIGAIDQRDIIEFGATYPLRLHDPEQTGVMQIAFGLRRQAPQFLGPGRAVAQLRNERLGAGDHGRIGAVVRAPAPRAGLRLVSDQHPPFRVPRYLARRVVWQMRPIEIARLRRHRAAKARLTGRRYLVIVYRLITN